MHGVGDDTRHSTSSGGVGQTVPNIAYDGIQPHGKRVELSARFNNEAEGGMTEAAHHKLGPSASERWISCTASHLATLGLPDHDTEWALQGSGAHLVSEICRAQGLRTDQWIGDFVLVKRVDGTHEKIAVDKQMRDGVQAFIDYVNDLPGDDYNEERVYYSLGMFKLSDFAPEEVAQTGEDEPVEEFAFGTMDAAKASWKELHIVDLKYGEGVQVYAKHNTQLMLYALGFLTKYGWMYDLDKVTLHVFQPRLDHVDKWEITVAELEKWAEETMRPAARHAIMGTGTFKPGSWCQFCKIKKTCAARGKYIFDAAAGEMEDLDAQLKAPLRQNAELTREQIAEALKRKAQVTRWFTDLESYVFAELAHKRPVGDWKIVEGRSNRSWAFSEEQVIKRIEAQGLDTKGLWTKPELISAPKAEELLGKKLFAKATDKKEAGKLADLIMKPRGAPKLAPGDDPREPYNVDPDAEMEEEI